MSSRWGEHDPKLVSRTIAKPRIRHNLGFALIAGASIAGSRWFTVVLIARLCSVETLGNYALGGAIAAPIVALTGMNLRSLQATDQKGAGSFLDYFLARLATVWIPVAVSIVAAVLFRDSPPARVIVAIAGTILAVWSAKEIYVAEFQRHERMELAALSRAVAGVLSVGVLALFLLAGSSLSVAICMQLGALATSIAFDEHLRRTRLRSPNVAQATADNSPTSLRRIAELIWVAAPLGIAAGLISIVNNTPRYVLEAEAGAASLGRFAAVCSLPFSLSILTQSLSRAVAPRLGRLSHQSREAFLKLLLRATVLALAVGFGGCVLSILLGRQILSLVLGGAFEGEWRLLVLLMLWASLTFVANILGVALTALGRVRVQVPLFLCVAGVSAGSSLALIPRFGAEGAAVALISASLVQIVAAAALVCRGSTLKAV